jgi:hypothetical protein
MAHMIKIRDEGSSSPFYARIFMGIPQLRSQLFLFGVGNSNHERAQSIFDSKFKPLLDSTEAVRDASLEIISLTKTHNDEITSGKCVEFRKNYYSILKSIDSELSQAVDKVLDQGVIATKTALQSILKYPLDLDIGFFFQQDSKFNLGLSNLESSGELRLTSYLEDVRTIWHSDLQKLRSKHEHHGWSLNNVKYELVAPSKIKPIFPYVLGSPVDDFVRQTANRILAFVENIMVYAMQRYAVQRNSPVFVVEIPSKERDPQNPLRFRVALNRFDKSTPWQPIYSEVSDFV